MAMKNENQTTDIPLITIGLTSYNAQDSIERALESALAQDWLNFEIVIVDDGSRDNSVSIIEKKIRNRTGCKLVVHKKNKGFPAALNTLIDNARGAFVAIFDDDDQSRHDRLSCQHKTITEYEAETGASLIACYGSGERVYPNGYRLPFQAIGSRPKVPVGMHVADYHLYGERVRGLFYGAGTPSCSLMARKSTFEVVGLYDEHLRRCEDSDFAIRLAQVGGHFIGCKEQVIKQFATGGADKAPSVDFESHRELIEKNRDYLVERNRYHYALGWQRIKFYHYSRRRTKALFALFNLALKHPVWTLSHFWRSAPSRISHERRMNG